VKGSILTRGDEARQYGAGRDGTRDLLVGSAVVREGVSEWDGQSLLLLAEGDAAELHPPGGGGRLLSERCRVPFSVSHFRSGHQPLLSAEEDMATG